MKKCDQKTAKKNKKIEKPCKYWLHGYNKWGAFYWIAPNSYGDVN
jgi:hypothetical protein